MTQSDIGIVEKLLRIPEGGNYPLAIRPNLPANPDGPEAAAIITEMVEALEEAREVIASDAAACKAFRHPDDEISRPEQVLSTIDTVLAKVRSK